jgi:hypothetical protein
VYTPEERRAALARWKAYEAAHYIPCPACDNQAAGPLHRTSVRLWRGRAERAQGNDGADPLSGVTLEDAERHLAAITVAEPAPMTAGTTEDGEHAAYIAEHGSDDLETGHLRDPEGDEAAHA